MNKCFKFLLLGKTGHGKSATGNTMLGERLFKTSTGSESKTSDIDSIHRKCGDFDILVVDSPGLIDTRFNEQNDIEFATKKYVEALAKCEGSIHAFLLVIKFKTRFTTEENKVIESSKAIFGENFLNNVIVVITNGDDFQESIEEEEDEKITFKEWCDKQTGPLADLFKDCKSRVVLFNNRDKTKQGKDEQLNQIIDIIKDWEPYTSECFEDANQQREELIAKHKALILKTEIQKAICHLQLEVVALTKTMKEEKKEEIEKQIKDLLKKIHEEDKGRGLLMELEANLKQMLQNLDDRNELIRLNKELDDLRKARDKWRKINIVSSITGGVLLFSSVVLALVPLAGPTLAAIGATAAAARLAPLAGPAIRMACEAGRATISVFSAGTIVLANAASKNREECEKKLEINELQKN